MDKTVVIEQTITSANKTFNPVYAEKKSYVADMQKINIA